ncbi:MAG: cadmium-translocating P-type ATPase [Hyphomicrobiales bacterium]|nr:cadmium-translocating P-type ATPase [Hyphomicrobiales bacterium]
MADRADMSHFVRSRAGRDQMDAAVEGIHCAGCLSRIEKGIGALPGVTSARVNFTQKRLSVEWGEGSADPGAVLGKLDQLGYRGHAFAPAAVEADEKARGDMLARSLAVAAFAMMNVLLLSISIWAGGMSDDTRNLFHAISAVIAIPAVAYSGRLYFVSAARVLRHGGLNMDVPISVGVLLATGLSVVETLLHAREVYFDSVLMLLMFLLAGRVLDQAMRRKMRSAAVNLAALRALSAERIEANGEVTTVPVEVLQPGDCVIVRPGNRIPADGVVTLGQSSIDASLVTGETLPQEAAAGTPVYAGTLNGEGQLTLRVRAATGDSLMDEIEKLIAAAETARSGYRHLADRAAALYAPVVHLAALLTGLGWYFLGHMSLHDALVAAISVLIITCPCALALAVPAVQVVASGALFRAGIILRHGDAIERLAAVDMVVFDKTGTLTLPEPQVMPAEIPAGMVQAAAQLALSSHHPLARALARLSVERAPCADAAETVGQGVSGTIDGKRAWLGSPAFCGLATTAPMADDARTSVLAFRWGDETVQIPIRQALRADVPQVVQALRDMGLDLMIVSGDREGPVKAVADILEISDWRAGVRPADKVALLEELAGKGRKVLMVGDGLNDAAALASAQASLSPVSASDITQAVADAIFTGDRLAPVSEALRVSRRGARLIHQNLGLAAVYNAIAVPLAVIGHVSPLMAAIAMSISSILVTVNSLRAKGSLLSAFLPDEKDDTSAHELPLTGLTCC